MRKLVLLAALTLPSLAGAQAPAGVDSSFTLTVQAPPAKKGQKSVAHIAIKPGPGFHMNKEYPAQLSLTPPDGVTLDKQKLGMKDAKSWEEQGGAFEVTYVGAQPGKKIVTGEVRFAVCSANSCDPKRSKVSFEIDVK